MTDLPAGWEWTTLYQVASWGSGGTPRRTDPRFYGGSIPWAVIGDLNDGVVTRTAGSITAEGLANSSAKLVQPGAVLLAMYGSIGKLGIAGSPMATNQAIAFAHPHSGVVVGRYLFHYLMAQRQELASAGKGATQKNISQTVLRDWPVPLPPVAEQERIVAAIEEHLSRLDAAESEVASGRSRTEVLAQRIIDSAWDPKWPIVQLQDVLAEPLANGRSVPTEASGFPVLRLTSLKQRRVDLSERKGGAWTAEDAAPFLVQEGDFLVSRGNGSLALVGRGGLVDRDPDEVAYPDTLIRVRTRADEMDPQFLSIIWDSSLVRRQIEGVARTTAGIYKVNQQTLRQIRIPKPPHDEQHRTVTRVDMGLHGASRVGMAAGVSLRRAAALRRSILAAAFSGKLVPQDPGDEPASVLLERTQAERASAAPAKRARKVRAS